MKSCELLLRVYAEREGNQWTLICLENSLAAQAETIEEAKKSLEDQLKGYLYDALAGQDQEHANLLLSRRAPVKYWIKYYYGITLLKLLGLVMKRHRSLNESLPLVPA